MNRNKILITGSNGLLGQKLVKLLTDKNDFDFIATARGENRIEAIKGFAYRSLDITSEEDVQKVLSEEKPNIVIHTAAMTNVDQCEDEKELCDKLNIDAVSYLAKACESIDAHLIHLSTDFIFDGEDGPYDEESVAPNPVSYYGESKLKAEQVLFNASCKWSIARTVLVYGITEGMSRSNIILWVKSSVESGKEINVVTDQFRSPTLAEDLAMGCYLIAKKGATGIFNISGEEVLTPYEMAIQTADYFKLDKNLIKETDGSKFQQKAKRPPKTGFIITKAQEILGYEPHTFAEGIEIVQQQVEEQTK